MVRWSTNQQDTNRCQMENGMKKAHQCMCVSVCEERTFYEPGGSPSHIALILLNDKM